MLSDDTAIFLVVMRSFEGQPKKSERPEEEKPLELPSEVTDYIDNAVEQSNGLLLQSRGILDHTARTAFEDASKWDEVEEDSVAHIIQAIDEKIQALRARSERRFDPSNITEAERKELYRKNPRRSSTRFKGLRK